MKFLKNLINGTLNISEEAKPVVPVTNPNTTDDDLEGSAYVSGGKYYTSDCLVINGKRYEMFPNNFSGTVDGVQVHEGQVVPKGGHYDMHGYIGPDGKVYK